MLKATMLRTENWLAIALRDLKHPPPGNVPALDFLRSMAILLVFFGHSVESFHVPSAVSRFPVVYFGWSGVDLFFVLSGLLIGAQLWKELKRTGAIDVPRFVLRRGFRIWPLYFSLVLGLIVGAAFLGRPLGGFLADLGCVSNYFHHRVGGGWSLSTEEQFYILCPAALFLGARLIAPRRLIAAPLIWLLMLPLIRWWVAHASGASLADIQNALYTPFHTHSDGLAMGLILAWLTVMHPEQAKARPWLGAALLLLVIPGALLLRASNQAVFAYTALALIYGTCALVLTQTSHFSAILSWRGFYVLSRLSYGIYLNHFGVVEHFGSTVRTVFGDGLKAWFISTVVCMTAAVGLAFITFALIELPFLRARERWMDRKAAAAAYGAAPSLDADAPA